MAPTKVNTWPPLISGTSSDAEGRPQLYGQEVLSSVLLEATEGDEFFYPATGGLSGFGSDGRSYLNGVQTGEPRASWYTEAPGSCRGSRAEFPPRALILLTDAGLTILDPDNQWKAWMTFLRGDALAFTHNALGSLSGFAPSRVDYGKGRVTIQLAPDPGADFRAPVTLVLDFVADRVYMDRPAYRAPRPGPYLTPIAYLKAGRAATANVPTLDLVDGGLPTFWAVYPTLPPGLHFSSDTGVITGAPEAEGPSTLYTVSAYNPGGVGVTSVTIQVRPEVEPSWFQTSWAPRPPHNAVETHYDFATPPPTPPV